MAEEARYINIMETNKSVYFSIEFKFTAELSTYVKKIPFATFDSKTYFWKVPINIYTVPYVEAFGKHFNFIFRPSALEYITNIKNTQFTEDDIKCPVATLRPFQKDAILHSFYHNSCYIADDMGLGKTITSIVSVYSRNLFPCLVICPSAVKYNWEKEIKMWTDCSVRVISGVLKDTTNTTSYSEDFIIINYDILNRQIDDDGTLFGHATVMKKEKFKSAIVDESHYLMNPKSIRTKSVKSIVKKLPVKIFLSGTPIVNAPKELIPQLDILGKLELFGGWTTFVTKFCNATQTRFGLDYSGSSNMDLLYNKLYKFGMIRRLKSEVLSDLPDKQRVFIPIDIDNRKEYDMLDKDYRKWIISNFEASDEFKEFMQNTKALPLARVEELKKAKVREVTDKYFKAEELTKMEKLKQVCADGKLAKVQEIVNGILETKQKVVIFATHRKICTKLSTIYKKKCVTIMGGTDDKTKFENIKRFQEDDDVTVFIGALDSAGVGITLTAASVVVFVEFGWTPAIHDQAEDRCYRIGQKNSVLCYYIYGKDTIDEDILDAVYDKRVIVTQIVDGTVADASYVRSDMNL